MTPLPRTPSASLASRRALVTGAGRGLGLAASVALAELGAHVILASRSQAELDEAAAGIKEFGGSAEALVLDLLDVAASSRQIAALGPLDVMICNAGTNRPKPMADVTPDDYDAVFDLNTRSAFFSAQAVTRGMIVGGKPGSIIFMSSQMGHVGAVERTIYCASKHAIEGLAKAMAVELAPHRIRVNTIAPTFIETPLTAPYFLQPGFREQVLGKIKLGRVGQVEDIMGAVQFLAGDGSGLVTGLSLKVDGGWTAE